MTKMSRFSVLEMNFSFTFSKHIWQQASAKLKSLSESIVHENYQFDEGPKSSWDYMSETSKCYTGIIFILLQFYSKLLALNKEK